MISENFVKNWKKFGQTHGSLFKNERSFRKQGEVRENLKKVLIDSEKFL